AIAIMTSLIYTEQVLSHQPSNIRPSSFHHRLLDIPRAELAMSFGPALDIISILSFVSVWIASAVLLSTYSRRIGKIRYWAIISIPLIYFLFPFEKNVRSEEHTSELQSRSDLVCRLLLEKKKKK